MVIIAIGERLKNIDKNTNKKLFRNIRKLTGKVQKGCEILFRTIISHHYFDVDAEEIFWVCENNMKPLAATIAKIINEVRAAE